VPGELLEIVRRAGEADPALRSAAVQALTRGTSQQLASLSHDASVEVRVAAVVALRRQSSARLADFLADAEPRVVVEAARAIYDEQVAEAMPALAKLIEREDLGGTALVRRVINANFRLGAKANAAALARFATRAGADELHRWEAVELLSKWAEPPGRDGLTGEWWPLAKRDASFLPELAEQMLAGGIDRAPTRVAVAWVRLAQSCGAAGVAPALVERASDAGADTAVRVASIGAAEKLSAKTLEAALGTLINDAEGGVRAAALKAVQSAAPEKAYPLLEAAAVNGSRDERRVAYAILAKLDDPRADALLAGEVTKLAGGFVPAEVALDLVEAAEQRTSKDCALALWQLRRPREADPVLAPFVDSLYGGDKAAGKNLFRTRHETECMRCHRIEWGEGGQVGPDLRGLGKRLSRVEILESICEPNRRIARGYEGVILVLDDGKPVGGVIVEENADVIKLRTAQDELIEIDAHAVESRRPDLSAMPQDLAKNFSREDMRDLIEYLSNVEELK